MNASLPLLLAGFVTMGSVFHGTATAASAASDFPDVEVPVGELGDNFLRIGRNVEASQLGRVRSESDKMHVIEALGFPDERQQGRREIHWFYNVNLPIANEGNELVCQYRISFSADRKVRDTEWRRHLCAELFAALDIGPEEPDEIVTLEADVLFDFDSAELSFAGRQEIEMVARNIRDAYDSPLFTLVGYADHLGGSDYNQRLSQQRAASVRDFLTELGFDRNAMVAEGRGSDSPVVTCPGTAATSELISCLRPNRRVEIEIIERGQQRRAGL